MTRPRGILRWLDAKSDWLSPLVVKEVRQVVRGREFLLAFGASLVAGIGVSFFGAAEALAGNNAAGAWTFSWLMGCLAFLGMAAGPLGAFNALRTERLEQTLELITLTALTPRRIVIGKLLAQCVRLSTLFATMAPFIATSFLLGGIDLVTILAGLVALFLASVWVTGACLFLSTAFQSRAMSTLIFGIVAVFAVLLLGIGRGLMLALGRGGGPVLFSAGVTSPDFWWAMAAFVIFWLVSLMNLVLMAENRLSLPSEDTISPLRLGFLVQFLLIVAWTMTYLDDPVAIRSNAARLLAAAGSVHLAAVAIFAVTEELAIPRRVRARMRAPFRWRRLLATFGPGAGRAAAYVLAQMALLVAAVAILQPQPRDLGWVLAACGYICLFTGIPVLGFWMLAPARATSQRLRVSLLIALAAAVTLPDLIDYIIRRPEVLDLSFEARHLINPFRTLSNWSSVVAALWTTVPFALGLAGLVAYVGLFILGARDTEQALAVDPARHAAITQEPGRGDVIY